VRSSRSLFFLTSALVAFAANSWICRFALRDVSIDPWSFTLVRVVSGAIALWPLARVLEPGVEVGGSWRSALALFGYAIAFSLAYGSLEAGTGALILFAAVQTTMIGGGLLAGERPGPRQWVGLLLALAGLVYLVSPRLAAPAPVGCALMTIAGAAWGVYSLRGRGGSNPVSVTAGNFLRATVPATAVWASAVIAAPVLHLTPRGILLATLSGALTSGVGYVLWYSALRDLTATTAAIVQLAVPVIAAAGGVLLLGERPTATLLVSGILILGGIALAVARRRDTR
jgi:drug/metabolite transporter (DMT)-like permease